MAATSKHEIVKYVGALTDHIRKHAGLVMAPYQTDFGDVIGRDSDGNVLVRVRGNGLMLPHTVVYWSKRWDSYASSWVDVVPVDQLAVGDRVSLVCTNGEYMVVGKVVLGG